MRRALLIGLTAIVLAGCEPRVSASSPEAFDKSVAAMTRDMSEPERVEFNEALAALTLGATDPVQIADYASAASSPNAFYGAADRTKGKTSREIIRLSYQAQIKALDQEIAPDSATLQRALAERARHRAVFDNVRVDGARYYVDRRFLPIAIVEFQITNNTNRAFAKGYFHGVLRSPGRSLPWVQQNFNTDFEGGLEPGETKVIRLMPFGAWEGDFSSRTDLVLQVELTNLDGVDGQRVLAGPAIDVKGLQAGLVRKQKRRKELTARL